MVSPRYDPRSKGGAAKKMGRNCVCATMEQQELDVRRAAHVIGLYQRYSVLLAVPGEV